MGSQVKSRFIEWGISTEKLTVMLYRQLVLGGGVLEIYTITGS